MEDSQDMAISPGHAAGDDRTKMFEMLARCYAPAVLGVCLAHTRSCHDAEDAMQDAMVKALASIGQVREPSRIHGWLLQIARRVCIDRHRRQPPPTVPLPPQVPSAERQVDPRLEKMHEAVSQLPDEYREAISLYYLDGRSSAAVALALGISEVAARQRLSRGRLLLYDSLKGEQP